MKSTKMKMLVLITVVGLAWGCASTRTLQVDYRLPAGAATLSKSKVALVVTDKRPNPEILGPGARDNLKDFTGRFILVVVTPDQAYQLTSAFDLTSALHEAFKRRLEQAGVVVLPKGAAEDLVLEIDLREFHMEALGSKWTMKTAYTATMQHNGRETANQTASGSGERIKIMGKREAENLLSDVVTDMVNKLDIPKLLDTAP